MRTGQNCLREPSLTKTNLHQGSILHGGSFPHEVNFAQNNSNLKLMKKYTKSNVYIL